MKFCRKFFPLVSVVYVGKDDMPRAYASWGHVKKTLCITYITCIPFPALAGIFFARIGGKDTGDMLGGGEWKGRVA